MNPWDILAWIFVALLGCVVVAILAVIIFLIVSISLYLRDKRREIAAQEQVDRRKFDGAPVPYFPGMEPGDVFKVDYQAWEIMTLETERLIEQNEIRLRVTARALSDD